MKKTKTWHEDDSFWELWGEWMFNPRGMAGTPDEAGKIIDLLGIEPGARVLDLGCGVGRFTLEFARRGFPVTGVDRTVSYLDKARQQAAEEGLDIEFVHEDMRRFARPEAFDAVISVLTSFGYFEDPEDDRRVVQNVCESLKSGGAFIIDTHGKETLAKIFLERNWSRNEELGVIVLEERKVTRNWNWMNAHWTMLRGNERLENEISHRLFAATELMALLTDNGFSRAEAYGSFAGIPYDHNARRLVVVGRK